MKQMRRILGLLVMLVAWVAVVLGAPQTNITYQTIKGVVMKPTSAQLASLQAQQRAGKIVVQRSETDKNAWYVLTPPKPVNSTEDLKAALSPGGDPSKYQPTDRNESLVGAFEAAKSPTTASAMEISPNKVNNVNLFNDRGLGELYPAIKTDLSSYNAGDDKGIDTINISTADTSGGRAEGAWTFGHEVNGHGTFKTITQGFDPKTDYDVNGDHDLNQVIAPNASNFEGWANYQGFLQVDPTAKNADGTPQTYTPEGFRMILNGQHPEYQNGIIDRNGDKIAENLSDPKLTFERAMSIESVNSLIYHTVGEKVGHDKLLAFAGNQDKNIQGSQIRQTQMDTLKNYIKQHPEDADKVIATIHKETNGKMSEEDIRKMLDAPPAGPSATSPRDGDGAVAVGAAAADGIQLFPSDVERVVPPEEKGNNAGAETPTDEAIVPTAAAYAGSGGNVLPSGETGEGNAQVSDAAQVSSTGLAGETQESLTGPGADGEEALTGAGGEGEDAGMLTGSFDKDYQELLEKAIENEQKEGGSSGGGDDSEEEDSEAVDNDGDESEDESEPANDSPAGPSGSTSSQTGAGEGAGASGAQDSGSGGTDASSEE
jgi:hypothetical protein